MKICTITCHDVYNHGASLQAYALQTYLESLGHDVRIIDYKPDYLSKHYNLWTVSNPVYDKPFVKQAYLLAKLPGRLIALKRKRAFDRFTKQYLKLTDRYHSNEALKKNPPQADIYIAGSDQIWNTLFQNGCDAAFYLDFAPKTAKRITYAASFATKDVVLEYKPFVHRMLQGLDCISLREKISLPLLSSLGRNDGVSVCDPVFLLSRKQWNELISTPMKYHESYLLVYDSGHSQRLKDAAIQIAKSRNLRIYNISAFRLSYADKDYWNSGPLDFVRLIRDAEFVMSNSFHATAFSLIFHREFCVVNRTEAINERMLSLLKQYGLQNRMLDKQPIPTEVIDYNKVQKMIDEDIAASRAYLHDALSYYCSAKIKK